MQKQHRKIYFWLIFSLFVIFAPLLIIFAAGYHYNWQTGQLLRTGSLYIKTQPSISELYLNHELHSTNTPQLINKLFPNEYQVLIKKDGYWDWQKKLTVAAGETVVALEIILFKKTRPETINQLPSDIITKKTNPDINIDFDIVVRGYDWDRIQKNIVYYTDHEIWNYQVIAQKKDLITRQTTQILEVAWYPLGNYIFFSDASGIYVIELDYRDYRQIFQLTDLPGRNLAFADNNRMLYFSVAEQLYQLQLFDSK